MQNSSVNLTLRHVCEEDCLLLWQWANDPDVRASSFEPKPVPWKKHIIWFNEKLRDPGCIHFIALDEHESPIGQARFDLKGDEAVITINVDRRRRGRGYGGTILKMAAERVFSTTPVRTIHAYIRPWNKTSINLFKKVGFREIGLENVRGNRVIHLIQVGLLSEETQ